MGAGFMGAGLAGAGLAGAGLAGAGVAGAGVAGAGPAGAGLVAAGAACAGNSAGGWCRLRRGGSSEGSGCTGSSSFTEGLPSPPSHSAVAATSPRNAATPPVTARHAPVLSLPSLQVVNPSVPPTMPAVIAGCFTADSHPADGTAAASVIAISAVEVERFIERLIGGLIRGTPGRGPWRPGRRSIRRTPRRECPTAWGRTAASCRAAAGRCACL